MPEKTEAQAPALERHRQMLSFYLERELYGFEIKYILQVIEPPPFAFVPRAPFFLRGAVNYRGKVIAVIDLGQFMTGKEKPLGPERRVIIIDSPDFNLGFLVDRVERIETIPVYGDMVQQPPESNAYILGVVNLGGRLFNIIDLEKLLKEIENYFS